MSLPQIPTEKIILPEYGRNVQKLVEHAMTIEDKAERMRCVKTIIDIMGSQFPHLRDVPDFKHKLWDHLAIMSNYKLDIDYPYEVPKAPVREMPDKIPYPSSKIYRRHYGNILKSLLLAADRLEGEEKNRYILILANQMKRNYIAWNKEVVDDKTIFEDLYNMTEGKIDLREAGWTLKSSDEIIERLQEMYQNLGLRKSNKKNGKQNGKQTGKSQKQNKFVKPKY